MIRTLLFACALAAAAPAAGLGRVQERALFDFRSGFWMNLHHYLHALGRSGSPIVDPLGEGTPAEQEQWRAAVDQYRIRYGRRPLLFDKELVASKLRLSEAASIESLRDVDLPAEHRALLESIAPIYRKHRWPAHDAANRRFVAAMQPLLAHHGAAIGARLARSYDATWPAPPLPVDVVHDAGPPGNAYTTNDPTHITMAANDPRHQRYAPLEILFHEASHGWDAILMKEVGAAAARLGVRAPRDLWHALLFFNAGTITADVLREAGVRDYRMYVDAQGMFERAYAGWRPAIARHWPDFLRGAVSRDEAIVRILGDLR